MFVGGHTEAGGFVKKNICGIAVSISDHDLY